MGVVCLLHASSVSGGTLPSPPTPSFPCPSCLPLPPPFRVQTAGPDLVRGGNRRDAGPADHRAVGPWAGKCFLAAAQPAGSAAPATQPAPSAPAGLRVFVRYRRALSSCKHGRVLA